MFKKLLFITALIFVSTSVATVAQPKIGYMSTQKVLANLPQRNKIQKELQSYAQKERQKYSQRATAYRQALTKFQKNKSSLSQSQLKSRQQKLASMRTSLNKYGNKIQNEIQQRQDSLLSPIFQNINNAIQSIAKKHNLDFVLNKSTRSGDNIIYYAADNQIDITQEVINRLTSSNSTK